MLNQVLEQAELLGSFSKSLNYKKILENDGEEVNRLKRFLEKLGIPVPVTAAIEALDNYAQAQAQTLRSPVEDDTAVEPPAADLSAIMTPLDEEGFTERMDKVYNSFSNERVVAFSQVPHQRGIPEFDVVLAPDFAPVAGMHGIFINQREVMSVVLASDGGPNADWMVLKRKAYSTPEEMVDMVMMVAAGFDLP